MSRLSIIPDFSPSVAPLYATLYRNKTNLAKYDVTSGSFSATIPEPMQTHLSCWLLPGYNDWFPDAIKNLGMV